MQDMAGEHGVYVALAHLVGFEGGKAFSGGSLVAGPRGDVLVEGPVFEEALVTASLDLSEIARVRAEMPLLADLETRLPHLLRSCCSVAAARPRPARGSGSRRRVHDGSGARARPPRGGRDLTAAPPRLAGVPHISDDVLEIDARARERWLVEFLRDEVSGGADSRRWSSGFRAAWTARWWRTWPPRRWARRT